MEQLNEKERLVLHIFSYNFVALNIPVFRQILGQYMTAGEILNTCNALQEKNLIFKNSKGLYIRENIALQVLSNALQDDAFIPYLPAMRVFEDKFRWTKSDYRYLRELFVHHYLHHDEGIAGTLNSVRYYVRYYFKYLSFVAGNPDFDWLFAMLGERAINELLTSELLELHSGLRPVDPVMDFCVKLKTVSGFLNDNNSFRESLLAEYEMLAGNFANMDAHLELLPEKKKNKKLTEGVRALYKNHISKACQIFQEKIKSQKASENFVYYEIYYVVYYVLSVLQLDTEQYMPVVLQFIQNKSRTYNHIDLIAFSLLHHAAGDEQRAKETLDKACYFSSSVSDMDNLFLFVAACHIQSDLDIKYLELGEKILESAVNNGYKLLALELSYSLKEIYKTGKFAGIYENISRELGLVAVLSRNRHQDKWEIALNEILSLTSNVPVAKTDTKEKSVRIVYFIDPLRKFVQPALQTATKTGNWTKGRNIAFNRFKNLEIEGMSEQDCRIANTLKASVYRNWGVTDFHFSDDVWFALVGHPYLFMISNPDIPVELEEAQPAISVEENEKGFSLHTDIQINDDEDFIIQKETNIRYKLIRPNKDQRMILQAVNRGVLEIPREGEDKLIKVLDRLSGLFTVHSGLTKTGGEMQTIEADSRIRVQLLPLGNSLKAELFVKPLSSAPPYCKPGLGGQKIIGTVEGIRYCAVRDMNREKRYAAAILQEIQQNTSIEVSQESIVFEDPRDSLYLLEILSKHQDIVVVEWPEGVRFKIRKSVSMDHVSLTVKSAGYWFEIGGNIRIDENTVLSMRQLLEMNTKFHGKFVELDGGEFIVLSNDLKKRLEELRAYTEISGVGVRANRFASLSLQELFEQAGSFEGDKKWIDFREKISETKDIRIEIPKMLQAKLRPYQEEGFRWLVSLSEWGAGACLADDMGLGKTVQALALLLHRAKKGAAFVVCPASVVYNWVSEANRFAPVLNCLLLNTSNREKIIAQADAFDVVITTYGLLQSEEALFTKKKWATIVLDEAHAIKNYNTKTSKAAMKLAAGFRLIMTGTPVQNNLSEIWNLFNFINPGLLGSLKQFNERFIRPDEKGGKYLKKLVTPFILRRTKNSVLEELPPKTEIVQQIELSDNERSFYEAVRRQAIENLQNSSEHTGQQHIKALAEITRLRLASCHPALVDPEINISSSKLSAFMEIVDELRGNNHRALVFSQFVKHLDILRKELDNRKIKYKYLDGTSSLPERERNVRDFQSGDGELFLISLKAGGLGLNLTAADYVIHMDPWWNPAIEDQASDRAHRIGQRRPVTIYRLVAKHTIEEKIIQLHHTKRDMADSLLEGADAPAKLSTEELLNLIIEN